ncbi:hypothetical protein RUND412_007056 [Rhizina undulata]
MGINQSGLNPENITFGIQVELVVAGFKSTSILDNVRASEHILHDMAQRLTDAGLKAESILTAHPLLNPLPHQYYHCQTVGN